MSKRNVPANHPWKQPRPYRRKALDGSFHEKIKKTNSCWIWTGFISPNGYGRLAENAAKKSHLAHRFSWTLHFGPIPDGLCVLHKCDVRHCVNPKHLFLGTHADNAKDAIQKGRTARGNKHGSKTHPWRIRKGSKHGNSKLTESKARQIMKLYNKGIRQNKLAEMFGVSTYPIHAIIHRKGWKHVAL